MISDIEASFHVLVVHLYVFFKKKKPNQTSDHLKIRLLLLLLSCMNSLYILDINPLFGRLFANIFSYPIMMPLHSVDCFC